MITKREAIVIAKILVIKKRLSKTQMAYIGIHLADILVRGIYKREAALKALEGKK